MFIENSNAFTNAEKVILGTVFANRNAQPGRGLVAGTIIETASGWQPVERVRTGESVYTYDGGKKPVLRVSRHVFGADFQRSYPDGLLLVPGGALDNCSAFYLLPEQFVLIESEVAAQVLGSPANLVPATALEGYRGIQRVMPVDLIEVITLEFEEEEVIYSNSGSLLHCPSASGGSAFNVLTNRQARAMLSLMQGSAPWEDVPTPLAA